MKNNYEIGIIGGGPAGSTAAAMLADYGFDVCLFEKKSFPRETLCGEFLSAEVVYLLKELKLFDEFISLHPNKINSFRFFNTSGKSVNHKFDFEAYGLSRSSFDNLLLCNAEKKGATVYQPAEVTNISLKNDSYELTIKSGNDKNIIFVDNLISAYGKQNALDNVSKRNFSRQKTRMNGIKFHVSSDVLNIFQNNEIQIYAADNIYCGVNAVENSKVTFCFLENRSSGQPPPRKQLITLGENNRAFKNLFIDDEDIFDEAVIYGIGNIYFGRKSIIESGIYMIGDAAGVIAPLAGDGISIAMESGKLIAHLFYKKRKDKIREEQFKSIYINEWNNLFLKRIRTAKIIQGFVLNKFGRSVGFQLTRLFPGLLKSFVESTRNILR